MFEVVLSFLLLSHQLAKLLLTFKLLFLQGHFIGNALLFELVEMLPLLQLEQFFFLVGGTLQSSQTSLEIFSGLTLSIQSLLQRLLLRVLLRDEISLFSITLLLFFLG